MSGSVMLMAVVKAKVESSMDCCTTTGAPTVAASTRQPTTRRKKASAWAQVTQPKKPMGHSLRSTLKMHVDLKFN